MKKNFLILIVSFSLITPAFAQIERGYNLIGGSASLGLNSDQFSIYVGPDFGYFIKDRFAVGGSVPIYFSDTEYSSTFTLGIMPFVRYYFGEQKTKVFVHGGLGFGSSANWYNNDGEKSKDSDFDVNSDLRAGIAHFLSDQVALEAAVRYQSYDIVEDYFGSFGIIVGFQIHLFELIIKKGGSD